MTSYRDDEILCNLYVQNLTAGNNSFPTVSGTSGQALTTNGSGTLAFSNVISGPGSSTTNSVPVFTGTTGTSLSSSSVTISSGQLTCSKLIAGALTFPSVDGTSGQAVTTNGSGTLSLTTVGNVTGPASSTNTAIAIFNGTTGQTLSNSSVTISSGQLTCSKLIAGALTFPFVDGTSGQAVTTNGSGTLSLSTIVSQTTTVGDTGSSAQTTHLSAGDHIIFSRSLFSNGNITIDTTSTYSNSTNTASIGRITIQAGTYLLNAVVPGFSATSFTIGWYNSDANTSITGQQSGGGSYQASAVITVAAQTRIEARIVSSLLLVSITGFVTVRQLA